MWEPLISQLIDELEQQRAKHGDVPVIGYSDQFNKDFPDLEPHYEEQGYGRPVLLLLVETAAGVTSPPADQ